MHHDGMAYFPVPLDSQANHGLLAMNHEYIDNGLLFKDGSANWDLNKARKGQNAMGVSIVEVKKGGSGRKWCAPRALCPPHYRQHADGHHRHRTRPQFDENPRRFTR